MLYLLAYIKMIEKIGDSKEGFEKKGLAILQVLLILSLSIASPLLIKNSFFIDTPLKNIDKERKSHGFINLLKRLISDPAPLVRAQEDQALPTLYCCERLRSGALCQTISQDELDRCDASASLGVGRCEEGSLDVCITGCFIKEGVCKEGVPKGSALEGEFFEGQSCSGLAQCKKVCAIVGTEALFDTKDAILTEAKKAGFPENEVVFKEDITTESECLALAGGLRQRSREQVSKEQQPLDCTNTLESNGGRGTRLNGESWCIYDVTPKEGTSVLGAIHYKASCVNGKQEIIACGDARQEICIEKEDEELKFTTAACVPNRWRQCLEVNEKASSLEEARELCSENPSCFWFKAKDERGGRLVEEGSGSRPASGFGVVDENGRVSRIGKLEGPRCLPRFPPGLDISSLARTDSNSESVSEEGTENEGRAVASKQLCNLGSFVCRVIKKKGLFKSGGERLECLPPEEAGKRWEWAELMNNRCMALGDCGAIINIAGEQVRNGYEILKGPKIGEDVNIEEWSRKAENLKLSNAYLNELRNSFELIPLMREGDKILSGNLIKNLKNPINLNNVLNVLKNRISVTGKATDEDVVVAVTGNEGESDGGSETNQAGELASKVEEASGKKITVKDVIEADQAEKLAGKVEEAAEEAKAETFFDSLIEPENELQKAQSAAARFLTQKILSKLTKTNVDSKTAIATSLAYSFIPSVRNSLNRLVARALPSGLRESSAAIFIGTSLVLFIASFGLTALINTFKAKKTVIDVAFICKPALPPIGGENCELCNSDERPCTEYRCKSLGASCELVNKGTGEEACVSIENDGRSPLIVDVKAKTEGYKVEKESIGRLIRKAKIRKDSGECADAFNRVEIEFKTDKFAICKLDTSSNVEFDEMTFSIDDFYRKKHILEIPTGIAVEGTEGINVPPQTEQNFFIKCSDTNGNKIPIDFTLNICTSTGPDLTPPRIERISPTNKEVLPSTTTEKLVKIWTNEPAECKWDKQDLSYEEMQNEFDCNNDLLDVESEGWQCSSKLPLTREENVFYFRCKDQPGKEEEKRNENRESYEYILRVSNELVISSTNPEDGEVIEAGPAGAQIELEVSTEGGFDEGRAACRYSSDNFKVNEHFFTITGENTHKTKITLKESKTIFVRCTDKIGNEARKEIRIEVKIDNKAPIITRIFEDSGSLFVITDEDATCRYSNEPAFLFDEGKAMPDDNSKIHAVSLNELQNKMYVKCRDKFENEVSATIDLNSLV